MILIRCALIVGIFSRIFRITTTHMSEINTKKYIIKNMKNKILDFFFNLSVLQKILLVITVDYLSIFIAWGIFMIYPELLFQSIFRLIHFLPISIAFFVYFMTMWFLGGYREIYRSFSLKSVFPIIASVFLFLIAVVLLLRLEPYSMGSFYNTISTSISITTLAFLLVIGSRLSFRFLVESSAIVGQNKVIIFGIGKQAQELFSSITFDDEISVIAFVSEDKSSIGREIYGVNIVSIKQTLKILEKDNSIILYLADSKINPISRIQLIEYCAENLIAVKTIAPYSKLLKDKKASLEDLSISDIIPRTNLDVYSNELKFLKDKKVLISGAGGSIGSELSRIITKSDIRELIIIDISEFALFSIFEELKDIRGNLKINALLVDIRNAQKIERVLKHFQPDIIYHSAAYKHVPLLEEDFNYEEAFENNFFATCSFADVAAKSNVDQFIFVSTDKAVRPTNLMGASKRLSEIYLQKLNEISKTNFSAVRFGNVMDSSGSVLQTFRSQLKKGGPLTVTHPEVNRYFMTIGEAAFLVIIASYVSSKTSKNKGIYMLKMGEPVKIYDIAKRIINLSGNKVKTDDNAQGIEIIFTGLRPGEKLYEELLINENDKQTEHPKIFLDTSNECMPLEEFKKIKESLKIYIKEKNINKIKDILTTHTEYKGSEDITD